MKRLPILTAAAGLVVLGVLLAAGGFTFAAVQESRDSFCASCHTQPESTYFQRSTGSKPVDLASAHTADQTRCIDCHSDPGISGRMQAELLGARNVLLWYTGRAIQPARLTRPISEATCLKCHWDVTQKGYSPKVQAIIPGAEGAQGGRLNHYHEYLARWQAASPAAGTCTSCHPGHSTEGSAQTGFQDPAATIHTCVACHLALRKGDGG